MVESEAVVAKVEHHLGELFPRVGFIVTQHALTQPVGGTLLQQARHRRAMDQRGEAGDALDAAVVPSIPGNEVRLQLSVLAYNLGNLCAFGLPKRIKSWSLTSLQHRLLKRAVGWSSTLDTTGWCWPRGIEPAAVREMLRRIWALPLPNG